MKRKGVELPKPTAADMDKFVREVNRKEIKLAIENFRSKAHVSENPFIRAINVSNEVDTSTIYPKRSPQKRHEQPNIVNDRGGEYMLSQGALPHTVHGRYNVLPTPVAWADAERRQTDLRAELASIERKILLKESGIRMLSSSSGMNSMSRTYNERALTAPVIGSTFRFHSIDARSTANNDYSWPEADPSKIRLKNTQYGLCTHVCDVPGGNLSIRPGVGRKTRAYKDYMKGEDS
jgi:hypothetical protein